MIRICRAEDGHVFQVNATTRDIERLGSLEQFLQQEAGVDHRAAVAYLTDGRRLTNANIRDLVGSPDQTIFVFNKYYLDYDIHEVLQILRVNAALQPPTEDNIAATPPFRPAQLASSYLRTSHTHQEFILATFSKLQIQRKATQIVLTNLDHHLLTLLDAYEGVSGYCQRELEKQEGLLKGLNADLRIVERVKIHVDFMSAAARRSIEMGEKHRTLGDYVSKERMEQVGITCARTHEDLRTRFVQVQQIVARLQQGTETARSSINDVKLLENAEACRKRAQELYDKITDRAGVLEGIVSGQETDGILQELRRLDTLHRNEVQYMTEIENAYAESCITILRHLSHVNNDMVQISPGLMALQTSFRQKNSFMHIQRLHNMLYAYGATVVEIVRRKEFSRFFYQRAQGILEVMAKLSAGEKKRRQVYRSEVHGQLPFETKGMDEPVPTIDFSTANGSVDGYTYSLERSDVDGLLQVLDDLEKWAEAQPQPLTTTALNAIRDCRTELDKLVAKMDGLESGFDKIAERSLLSASRLSSSKRRLAIEADEQAFQELEDRLQEVEDSKTQIEAQFREEREQLEAEIAQLRANLQTNETQTAEDRSRRERLEKEIQQLGARSEGDQNAKKALEERNGELVGDVERLNGELSDALAKARDKSREVEELKQELGRVKSEFEDVKELESRNAEKVAHLLEEQAKNLSILEEARARGDDLEVQIRAARSENEVVNKALKDAKEEKDKLLQAQVSERERIIRDHRVEVDFDRAVMERQFDVKLEALQKQMDRQIKTLQTEVDATAKENASLREELQKVEADLQEAQHIERLLREDLRTGQASQSDFERRLEESGRLIAQILDVAITFRNSHVKALAQAQYVTNHLGRPSAALTESTTALPTTSGTTRHGHGHGMLVLNDEPSPIDPSDPSAALEILRSYDHDNFLEAVSKTGSTVRKWQKQCRDYRERSKGKISFRNFAKGDLALFLPTRNSVSKPWAAFNVSFPHYFLQATGHLAETLRTREWIVARITSITERIVDHRDPSTNPYGLGDGVKYYMLEVEDWTQPSQNRRRLSTRRVSSDRDIGHISSSFSHRHQDSVLDHDAHLHSHSHSQLHGEGLSQSVPISINSPIATGGTVSSSPTIIPSLSPLPPPPPTPPPPPPAIPPGPPAEGDVEDTFRVIGSSNSRLFPVRSRDNSSPSARPSSLSRLLAQASPDSNPGVESLDNAAVPGEDETGNEGDVSAATDGDVANEAVVSSPLRQRSPRLPDPSLSPEIPPQRSSSSTTVPANSNAKAGLSSSPTQIIGLPSSSPQRFPAISPTIPPSSPSLQPPQSPSPHGSIPQHIMTPSPLRPGSRASRLSITSRRSVRIPTLGPVVIGASGPSKAAPTTALIEEPFLSSSPPSGGETNPFRAPSTPSPGESFSEKVGIPRVNANASNGDTNANASTSTHTNNANIHADDVSRNGSRDQVGTLSKTGSYSNITMLRDRRQRTASYHLPKASPLTSNTPLPGADTLATTTPANASPLPSPAMPSAVAPAFVTTTTTSRPTLTATAALVSLASSWRFGKKKAVDFAPIPSMAAPTADPIAGSANSGPGTTTTATTAEGSLSPSLGDTTSAGTQAATPASLSNDSRGVTPAATSASELLRKF